MVYCILYKVCILLFMYIVHFSYLVAFTAMAQSLVPKNFTISTLVYMMCDNKEILFDLKLNRQPKQGAQREKYEASSRMTRHKSEK